MIYITRIRTPQALTVVLYYKWNSFWDTQIHTLTHTWPVTLLSACTLMKTIILQLLQQCASSPGTWPNPTWLQPLTLPVPVLTGPHVDQRYRDAKAGTVNRTEQNRTSLFAWVKSQFTAHRKHNRQAARKALWLNNAGGPNSNKALNFDQKHNKLNV